MFKLANKVSTTVVLDRLGIAHRDRSGKVYADCPTCGENQWLVCEDGKANGVKCLHDSCAHVGPTDKPGFRTLIDLVAEREHVEPLDAAITICGWVGIEVPKPTGNGSSSAEPKPDDFGPMDYDEIEAEPEPAQPKGEPEPPPATPPTTPETVIARWRSDGPLQRVCTGIEALDRMCRGGLPIPWRVILVGAPSAGKTAVAIVVTDTLARAASDAGLCVGIVAVDEEDDDLTVRLLQIAGFTVAQAELRDPSTLEAMTEALAGLRLRFYDATHTIESAAADLAAWAATEQRPAMLLIDSLQAATSMLALGAPSPREHVEANVRAMRVIVAQHRMLVIATSEANRASYRNEDAADTSNDLAAGAESRAIEFGAQTQLVLRTPKDHPDVIHVRVAKNRRADRGEFWLRLDRDRHIVEECPDPNADPQALAERQEQRRAGVRAEVLRDAEALAALLVRHPDGLGKRELRAALKAAGHKWGVERLDAARVALRAGHKGVHLVEVTEDKRVVSRLVSDTESEDS